MDCNFRNLPWDLLTDWLSYKNEIWKGLINSTVPCKPYTEKKFIETKTLCEVIFKDDILTHVCVPTHAVDTSSREGKRMVLNGGL
jgi:hypothetical protein